jgi:transcriptional regulator with XRE-family HTH domain
LAVLRRNTAHFRRRENLRLEGVGLSGLGGERGALLLDEAGLTVADLSRLLGGSGSLGAMILRGDRNLTLAHVRKLAAHFQVSPELFVSRTHAPE